GEGGIAGAQGHGSPTGRRRHNEADRSTRWVAADHRPGIDANGEDRGGACRRGLNLEQLRLRAAGRTISGLNEHIMPGVYLRRRDREIGTDGASRDGHGPWCYDLALQAAV